jgi:hypothetical protein
MNTDGTTVALDGPSQSRRHTVMCRIIKKVVQDNDVAPPVSCLTMERVVNLLLVESLPSKRLLLKNLLARLSGRQRYHCHLFVVTRDQAADHPISMRQAMDRSPCQWIQAVSTFSDDP